MEDTVKEKGKRGEKRCNKTKKANITVLMCR